MVYLIGVNHDVQFKRGKSETDRFIAYLKQKIKELNITFIAEESSDDAKKEQNVRTTTVEDIAKQLKIEYRACDPTFKEREAEGIPSEKDIIFGLGMSGLLSHEQIEKVDQEGAKYHPQRERIWLKKIRDKKYQDMIFICGFDHLSKYNPRRKKDGFDKLLIQNGWEVKFLEIFGKQ